MKVLLFANTDWYLYNFRRSWALELQARNYDVLLMSPPGPYAEKLRALGLRWIAAPMERRSLNPLKELGVLFRLYRLMRQERPDVVHGFTIKAAVYGSLIARSIGVRARVNAVAGMGYVFASNDVKARLLRPVVRLLMRAAFDGADARLILQNPDDVAVFRDARLVDANRIRLIRGSGVDCQRFTPGLAGTGSGTAGATGRFRVLLPARLLWDKGIAEYIEASRRLRQQGRDIEFLLAGSPDEGNPAAVPEEAVRQWVGEGLVQWLGHVDDMPALFRSVDAMVLPSYYGEGVPRGLIEAAACGLALVTTDMPGCREVVTHEADGLLVPARDATALADAIARLQDDHALRTRLGAAARRKAQAEFDERLVIERTLEVYRELLGASLPGARQAT